MRTRENIRPFLFPKMPPPVVLFRGVQKPHSPGTSRYLSTAQCSALHRVHFTPEPKPIPYVVVFRGLRKSRSPGTYFTPEPKSASETDFMFRRAKSLTGVGRLNARSPSRAQWYSPSRKPG